MRRNGRWFGVMVGVLAATRAVTAQEPKGADALAGDWRGSIVVAPGVELRTLVHVTKEGDDLKVTFDSLDQKALGFETDGVELAGGVFRFNVTEVGGSFEGKVAADGATIEGKWKQGGMELPLVLKKGAEPSAPAELKGAWEGTLKAGGADLRLVLRVEPDEADAERLVAVLDSPDQGVEGIPVSRVELKDGAVSFVAGTVGGRFEGKLDANGAAVDGEWSQGGNALPLVLKRTEKPSKVPTERPQDPKGPLPYDVEEVTFANEGAGLTLAGTLTRPRGEGPFAAAVLVSGSGPQDRDESLLGHRPFLVLADALTRRGVAVLRYDDRGFGKSTGDFGKATTADFVSDALAAVRYLRGREEVAGDKVGIIGHSEGGLVGPAAAAEAPGDVAFVVMMAGPGVPGDEIILHQQALISAAGGAEAADVETSTKLMREVVGMVKGGSEASAIRERVAKLVEEIKEALPEADRAALGEQSEGSALNAGLAEMTSPWFRYFLGYDPRPALGRVRCPVLAMTGEKDLQVDPEQNLPEIERALGAGGNERFRVVELPGLNHLFQPCESGSPAEYARIETTIDPAALELIGGWVVEVTGGD